MLNIQNVKKRKELGSKAVCAIFVSSFPFRRGRSVLPECTILPTQSEVLAHGTKTGIAIKIQSSSYIALVGNTLI